MPNVQQFSPDVWLLCLMLAMFGAGIVLTAVIGSKYAKKDTYHDASIRIGTIIIATSIVLLIAFFDNEVSAGLRADLFGVLLLLNIISLLVCANEWKGMRTRSKQLTTELVQ